MIIKAMIRRVLASFGNHRDEIESPEPARVDATEIEKTESFCFDARWYKDRYKLDLVSTMALWEHYISYGASIGYDPCEFFWTDWYLQQYEDVARAGINPLLHYEKAGAKEGRWPSPLFDAKWYSMVYGVDQERRNPLAHFLHEGRHKGHAPRADAAISSFCRRKEGAAFDTLQVEQVAWKAAHVGQDAFYQGELKDGRGYLSEKGNLLAADPLLDEIAKDMADAGCASLPPYLTMFNDIIVIPGSTSLIDGHVVINDEITAAACSGIAHSEQKLWDSVWYKSGSLAIKYRIAPSLPIRKGFHLFKEYEANYFHFIVELLPKLHLMEKVGSPADIPLLVTDDLSPQMYEAVRLLKNEDREIIKLKRGVPYKVEHLLYLSDISLVTDVYEGKPQAQHSFFHDGLLREMSEILLRQQPASPRRRKLYLPRHNTRRTILNEAEIIDALVSAGFEIVDMQALSFKAQIGLFSSASIVVGGTGAAFTNLLWCSAGTKAIILYPDHPYNNTTFWDGIGRIKGLEISYLEGQRAQHVQGRYAMHDDFRIELDSLLRAIA